MRTALLAACLTVVAASAFAQKTRTEITKPTNPHDDSKPNSDEVPEVYTIPAKLEQLLVLRFKYQSDLLAGLERTVQERGIKNAVILSGIGSVRNYHIHSVSNRTFPSKNVLVKDPSAPADIVSVNGYVVNGKVHAHLTLTDEEKAFGGHLEPGTNAFTFAVITLGVFTEDTDLSRVDDKTYR